MSGSASELDTCPFCESVIPAGVIMIEYEGNGEIRVFAECFECEEPVQPQWLWCPEPLFSIPAEVGLFTLTMGGEPVK